MPETQESLTTSGLDFLADLLSDARCAIRDADTVTLPREKASLRAYAVECIQQAENKLISLRM